MFWGLEPMTQTPSDPNQSPREPAGRRRYSGKCHCGAVRFEAEIDLAAGTSRCNCSMCIRAAMWSAMIKPEAFTLVSGEESLSDYQHGGRFSHWLFCRHCGIRPFSRGDAPWMGGPYYAVNLNCIDDLDPSGVTVRHFNGRDNDWQQPRVERLP
jgi:hypothetical protein